MHDRDEYGFLCEQEWDYDIDDYPMYIEDAIDTSNEDTEEDFEEDHAPVHLSMRKSLLKVNGRRKGLHDLWDSPRFDSGHRSRDCAHTCGKDSKSYRRWQQDDIKRLKDMPVEDVYLSTVQGILEAEYFEDQLNWEIDMSISQQHAECVRFMWEQAWVEEIEYTKALNCTY